MLLFFNHGTGNTEIQVRKCSHNCDWLISWTFSRAYWISPVTCSFNRHDEKPDHGDLKTVAD